MKKLFAILLVFSIQASAKMQSGQVQIRLDTASSQMPKKKQRGPVAETFSRYYAPSGGLVPLVQVNTPNGYLVVPQYSAVPERVSMGKHASSFRVGTQDKISFTVTTSSGDLLGIKLFRCDRTKHGREYQSGQWASCLGGGGTFMRMSCQGFVPNHGLLVRVEKLTQSSYRVTSSPLDPGEYALDVSQLGPRAFDELVFTFGVGAPTK